MMCIHIDDDFLVIICELFNSTIINPKWNDFSSDQASFFIATRPGVVPLRSPARKSVVESPAPWNFQFKGFTAYYFPDLVLAKTSPADMKHHSCTTIYHAFTCTMSQMHAATIVTRIIGLYKHFSALTMLVWDCTEARILSNTWSKEQISKYRVNVIHSWYIKIKYNLEFTTVVIEHGCIISVQCWPNNKCCLLIWKSYF